MEEKRSKKFKKIFLSILKWIFNAVQIGIKSVLAILIVITSIWYLNKVFVNPEVDYGKEFRAYPEDALDVIVIGSSQAQYSFVPSFFYEDTGLYSYILGTACQPMEVSYEMLKECLKTQSPKMVILEVLTATPLKRICASDSCYVIAEYQMTGEEKYNTINYLDEEKAKSYYNDFLNYHNGWKTMTDYSVLCPANVLNQSNVSYSASFGYIFSQAIQEPANNWYPNRFTDLPEVELDELTRKSLDNIYALCEEKGITLYLYKTPMDSVDEEAQAYLEKVWEWARDKGVPYSDFLAESQSLDYKMCIHSDSFHAYMNGAGFLTDILGQRINNLEISFEHQPNEELDDAYLYDAQGNTVTYLNTEVNPLKVFNRLQYANGYVLIRYNPGKYRMNAELCSRMDSIVHKNIDYDNCYYAVIKNGEVICDSMEPFRIEIDGHGISIYANDISIDGNAAGCQGDFSIAYYVDDFSYGAIHNLNVMKRQTWELGYQYYSRRY